MCGIASAIRSHPLQPGVLPNLMARSRVTYVLLRFGSISGTSSSNGSASLVGIFGISAFALKSSSLACAASNNGNTNWPLVGSTNSVSYT